MAEIIRNKLWLSDIDKIIFSLPELDMLAGSSILITGAGGLICSAIADILIRHNETHNSKIHIYAAGRDSEKIHRRFGEYFSKDYFTFTEYDASRPDNIFPVTDYVIHGASSAHPSAMVSDPVGTMLANITGINSILEHSRKASAKRVLYISSSEVYGQRAGNNIFPFSENDYGYVDLLNVRSCYPMGKRSAETLCVCYYAEYGVDSVIARPGHIYGPKVPGNDNRVALAFAYDAALRKNIIMKSEGLQVRSWGYCLDCAGAILKILLAGESVHAYNIPGEIMSIREMAEILADAGGVELIREGASDSERKAFNPMNNSSLDGTELEALGWKNIFDAHTGLNHTVEILRDIISA